MPDIDINILKGRYLRGVMEKKIDDGSWNDDTTAVFLFLSRGDVYCFVKHDVDGHRDDEWEFRDTDNIEVPMRDSDYKAIGEYIKNIETIDNGSTIKHKIHTKTKILDFTTNDYDDYYPDSIWEMI